MNAPLRKIAVLLLAGVLLHPFHVMSYMDVFFNPHHYNPEVLEDPDSDESLDVDDETSAGEKSASRAPSGLYYPLGRTLKPNPCGGWLERGPPKGCYDAGKIHLGMDLSCKARRQRSDVGEEVYAPADVDVVEVSWNGWGNDFDGRPLAALILRARSSSPKGAVLYVIGHITPRSSGSFKAGQVIGTTALSHVHVGVWTGKSMPPLSSVRGYGRQSDSIADTGSWVNPLHWFHEAEEVPGPFRSWRDIARVALASAERRENWLGAGKDERNCLNAVGGARCLQRRYEPRKGDWYYLGADTDREHVRLCPQGRNCRVVYTW